MTAENQARLDRLFTRFGSPSREAEVRVNTYLVRADAIKDTERIAWNDKSAAETIQECESMIETLKAYRLSLAERYNYLETAAAVPVVRLKRRHDCFYKKVYYDLTISRRYVESGDEVEQERKTYKGTDRSQAIKDYKVYIKAHPGIIAELDIEKGKWEH